MKDKGQVEARLSKACLHIVIGVGRGSWGAGATPIFFWRGQSPPNILGLILVDI